VRPEKLSSGGGPLDKIGYWYQYHCQLLFVQPCWHVAIQAIQRRQKYLQCKNCSGPLRFIEDGQAQEYGEYYLEEK